MNSRPFTLFLSLKVHFSTRIELFYFDDNFHRIAQWVSAFTVVNQHGSPADCW